MQGCQHCPNVHHSKSNLCHNHQDHSYRSTRDRNCRGSRTTPSPSLHTNIDTHKSNNTSPQRECHSSPIEFNITWAIAPDMLRECAHTTTLNPTICRASISITMISSNIWQDIGNNMVVAHHPLPHSAHLYTYTHLHIKKTQVSLSKDTTKAIANFLST